MTEAEERARRRVAALLARAERTTYPAEAEACRRKAAELVERHRLVPVAPRRDPDRELELVDLLRRWLDALAEAEAAAEAANREAAAGNAWAEAYTSSRTGPVYGQGGVGNLRRRFAPRPPPAPWQP